MNDGTPQSCKIAAKSVEKAILLSLTCSGSQKEMSVPLIVPPIIAMAVSGRVMMKAHFRMIPMSRRGLLRAPRKGKRPM